MNTARTVEENEIYAVDQENEFDRGKQKFFGIC